MVKKWLFYRTTTLLHSFVLSKTTVVDYCRNYSSSRQRRRNCTAVCACVCATFGHIFTINPRIKVEQSHKSHHNSPTYTLEGLRKTIYRSLCLQPPVKTNVLMDLWTWTRAWNETKKQTKTSWSLGAEPTAGCWSCQRLGSLGYPSTL